MIRGLQMPLGERHDVSDQSVGDAGSAGGLLYEYAGSVVLHCFQTSCDRLQMWSSGGTGTTPDRALTMMGQASFMDRKMGLQ